MTTAELFEQERARLISLTYRMLGIVEDAEDAVQETWFRFEDVDLESIRNPGAWLTTVATRVAIDRQRSNAVKRETYVGPWLPEPMASDPMLQANQDPADHVVLAESVSIGFLSVLERLSATERAVFLLREVFALPMAEIADIVDRSEPATRQIAKRARDRVRAERPRFQPEPDEVAELTDQFLQTLLSGDVAEFGSLLTSEVVVVSDGGADYRAARAHVVGRKRVARYLVNLAKRQVVGIELHLVEASGQPCLYLTRPDERLEGATQPFSLLTLNWDEGAVHSVMLIRNEDKLRAFHQQWSSSQGRPGL